MEPLRLLAVDAEDLQVVSTYCQDAVLKLKDCRYDPQHQQFIMEMNRFVWEDVPQRRGFGLFRRKREYERRRAVLHFDRVFSAKRLDLDLASGEQVLVLLAIRFTPGDPPSGSIELVFGGGATIRLEVEVIEAQLTDVGGAWSTAALPDHENEPL